MFDDMFGGGMLARSSLFRKGEQSADVTSTSVHGGSLSLMLRLGRENTDRSWSRDVIDGE